jgi:hypothetical protein
MDVKQVWHAAAALRAAGVPATADAAMVANRDAILSCATIRAGQKVYRGQVEDDRAGIDRRIS